MSIGKSSDGKFPEDKAPAAKARKGKNPAIDPDAADQPSYAAADRPSIGQVLQHARIAANMTVEEVSAVTRVRIPIVQSIEQDDFSPSGGDVYARGHIRMLARQAGIDPDPLVEQFDAEHGGNPATMPAGPLFEAERIKPERRRPNWTAAMAAAIVAVVGFVGFTAFNGDDSQKTNSVADGPTPEKTTAKPTVTRTADPKPDPSESAIAAAPRDKVTVKLSAVDDQSWISAKSHSGKMLFDGLLAKGDSKTFQDDKQIDLILGNAGAIELFVNGKKVEDHFESGQVERLSYTQGDPEVG